MRRQTTHTLQTYGPTVGPASEETNNTHSTPTAQQWGQPARRQTTHTPNLRPNSGASQRRDKQHTLHTYGPASQRGDKQHTLQTYGPTVGPASEETNNTHSTPTAQQWGQPARRQTTHTPHLQPNSGASQRGGKQHTLHTYSPTVGPASEEATNTHSTPTAQRWGQPVRRHTATFDTFMYFRYHTLAKLTHSQSKLKASTSVCR